MTIQGKTSFIKYRICPNCWDRQAKVNIVNTNAASDQSLHCLPIVQLLLNTAAITMKIQSTVVISNSKGLSEILRDIRTSTYQICRIEEKLI